MDERMELLLAIQDTMSQVQQHAESLAGYVLELEKRGVILPAMRQAAKMLAQMAMGWEAAGPPGLTPSADVPACRDEDPAHAATLAACYPPDYQHPEDDAFCPCGKPMDHTEFCYGL